MRIRDWSSDVCSSDLNHHFRKRRYPGFDGDIDRRLENGARLHFVDFRISDTQSASAMSKHGIKLMQFSGAAFQRFHADAGSLSHFSELCLSMRQKFVERRVEQPDCDRKAGHHAENPREIAALLRKQLCQRLPSALFRFEEQTS